jgi:hypothetical protein
LQAYQPYTHVEDELDKIRKDINQKTHFAYICISDLRYHSLGNVVKIKFAPEITESTEKEPNDTDKSHNEATNPNSKHSFTKHEKVNYYKSITQPCEHDNKRKCKNYLLISKTIVNEDTIYNCVLTLISLILNQWGKISTKYQINQLCSIN